MKRKIAVILTVIVALTIAGYAYYVNFGPLQSTQVASLVLDNHNGSVMVEQTAYDMVLNLVNVKLGDSDYIENSSEHAFRIVAQKNDGENVQRQVYIDKANNALYLVGDAGTAQLALDDPAVQTLLNNDLISKDQVDATLSQLSINIGERQVNMAPVKNLWRLKNLEGEIVSRLVDSFDSEWPTLNYDDENFGQVIHFAVEQKAIIDNLAVYRIIDGSRQVVALNDDFSWQPVYQNGEQVYEIELETKDTEVGLLSGRGTIIYRFVLATDVSPKITIDKTTALPGDFFAIRSAFIDEGASLEIEQSILADGVISHQMGAEQLAVIPLDYWTTAGDYPAAVYLVKDGQKTLLKEFVLTVQTRDYSVQNLVISQTTVDNTQTAEGYREYNEEFTPIRNTSADVQYWEGAFIKPVEGRLTTDYGTRRRVNGAMTTYRHNGIDIAAPTGTPIKATNTGKVVFVKNMILTGNTIVIDHGLGFFSYYLHMNSTQVNVGDMVKKADIIGTVGSTGFSTGAHLHFTITHHLKNINPFIMMEWDGTLPQYNLQQTPDVQQ